MVSETCQTRARRPCTAGGIASVSWCRPAAGDRRFPGEFRLPGVACLVLVLAEIERGGKAPPTLSYTPFSIELPPNGKFAVNNVRLDKRGPSNNHNHRSVSHELPFRR